jgi:tetratricopeptide (TPR) repeat protein
MRTNALRLSLAAALLLCVSDVFARTQANWGQLIAQYQNLVRQGKYADALPVIRNAVELAEQFPDEDTRRLDSAVMLASLLDGLGKYDEAIAQYSNLLSQLGGKNSATEAGLLRAVGRIHVVNRRYEDALAFYDQALKIDQKLFPENDPRIAVGLLGMTDVYLAEGRHKDAEPYARKALTLTTPFPKEASYLHSLRSLGWVYCGLRRFEDAQPLFERLLEASEDRYAPNDPQVADAVNNLASLYYMKGDSKEAGKLFRRVLSINEQVLGPEHPTVAYNINDVAVTLDDQRDEQEKEGLLRRSLAIMEKVYGPTSPKIAMPAVNLGSLLAKVKKSTEAEKYFRRAVEIEQRDPQVRDTPIAATALSSLAMFLMDEKRYDESEPIALQALDIAERKNGEDDVTVARYLDGLAELYSKTDRIQKALQLAERSVRITDKNPGSGSVDYGHSLLTLADVHSGARRFDDAEPLYAKAIAIFETHSSKRNLQKAFEAYAKLLDATNRPKEATEIRRRIENGSPKDTPK